MKARLFMARLLVMVMLLNSVLPAYASVNTMVGFGEPTIVETVIDGDSAQYTIATDSVPEEIEQETEPEDPVIEGENDSEIEGEISEMIEVELDASDLPDDDELLDGFVEKLFYEEIREDVALFGNYGVEELEGVDEYVYDTLYSAIGKIAVGEVSSPDVVLSMNGTWTLAELGITSVNAATIANDVSNGFASVVSDSMDLMLVNCPYELYWMDKTKATTCKASLSVPAYDETTVTVD